MNLLYLLISDYDSKHRLSPEMDLVELVKSLMEDHGLNQQNLTYRRNTESYISENLNYKKRMSKEVIRNIPDQFKIHQKALKKEYRLDGEKQVEEIPVEGHEYSLPRDVHGTGLNRYFSRFLFK